MSATNEDIIWTGRASRNTDTDTDTDSDSDSSDGDSDSSEYKSIFSRSNSAYYKDDEPIPCSLDNILDKVVDAVNERCNRDITIGQWGEKDDGFITFKFYPGPYSETGGVCWVHESLGKTYIDDIDKCLKHGVSISRKYDRESKQHTLTISLGEHSDVIDMTPYDISEECNRLEMYYEDDVSESFDKWCKLRSRPCFRFERCKAKAPTLDTTENGRPTYTLNVLHEVYDAMFEPAEAVTRKIESVSDLKWKVVGYVNGKHCLEVDIPEEYGCGTLGAIERGGLVPYVRGTLNKGVHLGGAYYEKNGWQSHWASIYNSRDDEIYDLTILELYDKVDDLLPLLKGIDDMYAQYVERHN